MDPAANPEAQKLLEQLHGVLPPAPSSSLPAIGWILLGGLLITALLALLLLLLNRWRRERYRRAALAELDQLPNNDAIRYATDVNQLLKRVAMTVCGREMIAEMHGDEWRDLLQKSVDTPLDSTTLYLLGGGLYQPAPHIDPDRLQKTARLWIRKHRRSKLTGGSHGV